MKLSELPAKVRALAKEDKASSASKAIAAAKKEMQRKRYERDVKTMLTQILRLLDAPYLNVALEYEFAFPSRRWAFDFAWTAAKVALEVDGGVFQRGGGRHNRGKGFRDDLDKLNAAVLLGWRVIRVLSDQVARPETAEMVARAIRLGVSGVPQPLTTHLAMTPKQRRDKGLGRSSSK